MSLRPHVQTQLAPLVLTSFVSSRCICILVPPGCVSAREAVEKGKEHMVWLEAGSNSNSDSGGNLGKSFKLLKPQSLKLDNGNE